MIIIESTIIILAILFVAVLGKAYTVAAATSLLLILNLLHVDQYVFPILEKSGMRWGLVLILACVLIPIANGNISVANIKNVFTSWIGVFALLLSLFTTYLSGLGLEYLTIHGHSDVMPALILGAVLATIFLGGVPVGPLITSGMLALGLKLLNKL